MSQRDVPRLPPEQAIAIARDLLADWPGTDVLAVVRKLMLDADRLRGRSPTAAANYERLAEALLSEAKRRAH
jgi:hypothetical protein